MSTRIAGLVAGALAAGVLTLSTVIGQPTASAAPLSEETGNGQPTSVQTDFTGWQDSTAQDGWELTHADGKDWTFRFLDIDLGRPANSDGTFAGMYGEWRHGNWVDTSLVSPAVDLTGQGRPVISFDSNFVPYMFTGSVELSLDGGATWSTVRENNPDAKLPDGQVTVPIPQAGHHSDVRVRFHAEGFTTEWGSWSIDNVFIGTR